MLAGPPCQGFSLANRRSRTHENPLNALSLAVLPYVRILEPRVLILENVPGIRTLRSSSERGKSVMDALQRGLARVGYVSRVLLLDAADYGVPQFRLRSFLVAVRRDFARELPVELAPPPTHGPGRGSPYVTVAEALTDLPAIGNGHVENVARYRTAPVNAYQRRMRCSGAESFSDHLTSKHSPYVLERYAQIPPGENWTSIRHMMSNYADPERTHLNIYYRLDPDAPSRTIGNFRKAMMIHPFQTRGLSLREAARLQSLPDWMTFVEPSQPRTREVVPGLNVHQQQVGNAVSYLLTEALVSHVIGVLGFRFRNG